VTESHAEIERKFELGDAPAPPDLTGVDGVASSGEPATWELEATYYDTPDLRLARHGATLRRRTGGHDAGWHLKLPVSADERTELAAPLDGDRDAVPSELVDMVRARIGTQPLDPVATLRTTRVERALLDGSGAPLANITDDVVHARRARVGSVDLTEWREIELELAGAGSEALLDALSDRLIGAGLQRADSRSKLHRVLGDDVRPAVPETGSKAADCLLGYAAEQVEAIVSGDARVRVDDDEAVHDMRVGTRRLRSHLATFRPFFEQRRTERLRDELKWLGQELGRLRDSEVLRERLQAIVEEEPPELVLGPVADRVTIDMSAAQRDARESVLATLDSERYVDLLEDLHELIDDPPWAPDSHVTTKELRRRVAHAFERMDDRAGAIVDEPLDEHVTGLHDLRKAAKRARYAAESVAPLFGKDATRAAARAEALQDVLGEHQDSIQSQHALRRLGVSAHLSGENGFTFGVLLGGERQRAAAADDRHGEVYRRTTTKKVRGWLTS
jgi:CHAD domain-containing protein